MSSEGDLLVEGLRITPVFDDPNSSSEGPGTDCKLLVQRSDVGLRCRFVDFKNNATLLEADALQCEVWKASDRTYFVRTTPAIQSASPCAHVVRCVTTQAAHQMSETYHRLNRHQQQQSGAPSVFEMKTNKGSADLYFHYYGMLQHQQNMLQDYVRTGTYYAAIMENAADFQGKAVMDVGAGSGILSLFAAQAGARVVYAVEASEMAGFAAQLAEANPGFGSRVKVIRGKVEEIELPEKIDILVSEPMGTLLLNERMLETYLYARDNYLRPGGALYPQLGRIHIAAFQDEALYAELLGKATFWMQSNFYGVDVTALQQPAVSGYFTQVVVDAIDPTSIISSCATHVIDFRRVTDSELYTVVLPLKLQLTSMVLPAGSPCSIHGCACWFDVQFQGSGSERWLSTAPGMPTTHWFQLRCVLEQPLQGRIGDIITGEMRMKAHERQSYDIHLVLNCPPLKAGDPQQQSSGKYDLKEPYYRQLTMWYSQQGQQQFAENGGHS